MLLLFLFLKWRREAVGKSPLKCTSLTVGATIPRSPGSQTAQAQFHTQISRARQLKVIRLQLEAPSIFIVREGSREVSAFQEVLVVYDLSLPDLEERRRKYQPTAPFPSLGTLWRLGPPEPKQTLRHRQNYRSLRACCITLPSIFTILG